MSEKTPIREETKLTHAQLAEVLGCDEIDVSTSVEIQVCAGNWVRRPDDLWDFDKDPEWDE